MCAKIAAVCAASTDCRPNPTGFLRRTASHCVTLEQDRSRDADAAITREAGRVAVVMVADCLPLLLCNRDGSEVAAVHAGWRGLQAGVIRSSLAQMQSGKDDLMAWIGPGISKDHFEVGDEVREAFEISHDGAAQYFQPHGPGHWLCDLAGLAELELEQLGVGRIARDAHCTYRRCGSAVLLSTRSGHRPHGGFDLDQLKPACPLEKSGVIPT